MSGMSLRLILAAVALALAGFAADAALADPPATNASPPAAAGDRPSPLQISPLLRFYPDRAMRMGVAGDAKIRCRVTATLTLDQCAVVSETPPDMGFGEAALKMLVLFKMKPTEDGHPTAGAIVTIPIHFAVPD